MFCSQCTVRRTSLRYQLRPSDVLVVRRGNRSHTAGREKPSQKQTLPGCLKADIRSQIAVRKRKFELHAGIWDCDHRPTINVEWVL